MCNDQLHSVDLCKQTNASEIKSQLRKSEAEALYSTKGKFGCHTWKQSQREIILCSNFMYHEK